MKFLLSLSLLFICRGLFAQEMNDCFEKCHYSRAGIMDQQRVMYFQYPSMEKYDVRYLKLDLSADPGSRAISGNALTTVVTKAVLDSFIIELRDNMTVDSVFINGVRKNFTRGSDHIFVPLSPAIPANSTMNVLIYYFGTANSNGVFSGTQSSTGLVYTATLSESYQAREWFPAKQMLHDKIDSADIWITTSIPNLVGSNGVLQSIVDGNARRQVKWKTTYPMAYYLVSFATANYMEYKNYAKPPAIAPDSILIQHYIVNNNSYFTSNKANLDRTPPFLEKMSELYGLYPFHKEKYGHAQAAIGGGMEHQTMSTMASFGATLVAHELGHQWFGDNVTCATWNHIWINEGFASYSEYLMIQHLPSLFSTTAATYMQNVHNNVMTVAGGSVFVPDAQIYNESRIFDTRLSYNKGSAIIHNLRFELQNDATFYQVLKNFQQQFADSVATADDFKRVAENTSGKNLTDFFSQWYYGEGFPTFNVDYSKQGDSLVLFVNQTVSMPLITPFFKGLYEFTFNTTTGDTTVKVNMTTNNQTFKFRSNRVPTGIVVDPNNWVINRTGSITTGTNDPGLPPGIKIYPNPAPGTFITEFPVNKFQQLRLADISGRIVYRSAIAPGTTTLNTSVSLPRGVYVLTLHGNSQTFSKKMFIY